MTITRQPQTSATLMNPAHSVFRFKRTFRIKCPPDRNHDKQLIMLIEAYPGNQVAQVFQAKITDISFANWSGALNRRDYIHHKSKNCGKYR